MVSRGWCEAQVEAVSSPSSSRGRTSQDRTSQDRRAEAHDPGRPEEGAPGTDLRLQPARLGFIGDGSWKAPGLES